MKIAFIHDEKKINTGAHYINDLISSKLRKKGVEVRHFYPTANLIDAPKNLKGTANILFFYSLLEHREKILKCDLIQGTTYTPLTFLPFDLPVISHFGSTTKGFLDTVPDLGRVESDLKELWQRLKKDGVIKEIDFETRRPLRDIAEIEKLVATRANAVVATSSLVKDDLIRQKVPVQNISIIHNAIEDYWFSKPLHDTINKPKLVFLGRLGNDAFNLKLKGFDRLMSFYEHFPKTPKITVGITTNEKLSGFMKKAYSNHQFLANITKNQLPELLRPLRGSILFIPSRYEGFSLSLIEGMSQGLIPIVYPVGVAPEIIKNGENGFLVKDVEEAVSAAHALLGNKALRLRMSKAAHETSLQFTSEIMVEKFITLYEQVIRTKENKKFSFKNFFKFN